VSGLEIINIHELSSPHAKRCAWAHLARNSRQYGFCWDCAIPLQPAVAGDMANGDNALLPDVKIKKFYYNPTNHGIFCKKSFGKCSHHHNGCYY
jgi:hypothetical protein